MFPLVAILPVLMGDKVQDRESQLSEMVTARQQSYEPSKGMHSPSSCMLWPICGSQICLSHP